MDLRDLHARHPMRLWLLVIGAVAAAVGVGLLVDRTATLGWLWEHFGGPLVSDAQQRSTAEWNGIQARDGYTIPAEITYAVIAIAALISIRVHVFQRRGVSVDERYIWALLPVVFAGPLIRALEDADLFCRQGTVTPTGACDPGPVAFLFISPIIYIVLGLAVAFLTIWFADARERSREDQGRQVLYLLGATTLVLLVLGTAFRGWFSHDLIWAPFLALVGVPVYHRLRDRSGWDHVRAGLLAATLPWALIPAAYTGWFMARPWIPSTTYPAYLPWVVGSAFLATLVAFLIGKATRRRFPDMASLTLPLGLGIVAGHMIDGFATFYAICQNPGGQCSGATFSNTGLPTYGEKHPVSDWFLGQLDGWGFPLIKFFVAGLIVVAVHRALRLGKEDPDMAHLLYLAILVLGLAPGVRDIARAVMGV